MKCLYSKHRCHISDKRLLELFDSDIIKFMNLVCSFCIKNRYARAKERLSKLRYTVVNTL